MSAPKIPFFPLKGAIPKVLHQIYFQPGDCEAVLPEILATNVGLLRQQNPEWAHRLYGLADMEAFIAGHYGQAMLSRFQRISLDYGAAKADLFRYLTLYKMGGIYLDIKSRFVMPIDTYLQDDDQFLLSQWRNGPGQPHAGWGLHAELVDVPGGEFQQWHIIAAPGHPFLRAVIERVVEAIDSYRPQRGNVGWTGVLNTTGPIVYTRAITPLIGSAPCRLVADETELGLEYSVLERSAHQRVFSHHYTRNTSPVINRPWPGSWLDQAFIKARNAKHSIWKREG